jgi:hypothetical protein
MKGPGAPVVREVEALRAGSGPGGALAVRRPGDAAVIRCADAPTRPTVTAHATDPGLPAPAGIPGLRVTPDAALPGVFRGARTAAAPHPGEHLLVARAPGKPGAGPAAGTEPGHVP